MSDFKIVKLVDNPVILQFTGGITPKGAYDNGTTYATGDSVSYGISSYVAIQATTGNLPTDTTYWQLLAQGGAGGGGAIYMDQYVGSNCSGTDGQLNRQLVLNSTPFIISIDGTVLTLNTHYSMGGNTATFLTSIYDEQKIDVWRFV